jgi:hypothetical protein
VVSGRLDVADFTGVGLAAASFEVALVPATDREAASRVTDLFCAVFTAGADDAGAGAGAAPSCKSQQLSAAAVPASERLMMYPLADMLGKKSKTAQYGIGLVSEEGPEFIENVLPQLFAANFEEVFLLVGETSIAAKCIMGFE